MSAAQRRSEDWRIGKPLALGVVAPHEGHLRVARLERGKHAGDLLANELQVRCVVCWPSAAHQGHVWHEGLLVYGQPTYGQLAHKRPL